MATSGAAAAHTTPMEVDQVSSVVCKNTNSSGVIFLHPLVAMNITDHATRYRITNKEFKYALGVLLGKQNGREVEITNSFDVCYDVLDNSWILNREYLDNKLDHISQVLPGCDVVGWYCLGHLPTQAHIGMHTQISQVNESPILLMFNPCTAEQLAIRTYESIIDMSGDESRVVFVEVQYTVRTTEAEQIGVDHAAGASVSGLSAVSDVLGSHQSAISMLNGRVNVICDYIRDVKAGKLKPNAEILRAISSLVATLPQAPQHTATFDAHSEEQLVDALMITSLATLTKGFMTHDEVATKSSVIHSTSISSKKVRSIDIMGAARNMPI